MPREQHCAPLIDRSAVPAVAENLLHLRQAHGLVDHLQAETWFGAAAMRKGKGGPLQPRSIEQDGWSLFEHQANATPLFCSVLHRRSKLFQSSTATVVQCSGQKLPSRRRGYALFIGRAAKCSGKVRKGNENQGQQTDACIEIEYTNQKMFPSPPRPPQDPCRMYAHL